MLSAMGRTVIVSEETIRSLVEANAALAAWYHELLRASREQKPATTPSEETRNAFLRRIGQELPEVSAVVNEIATCRVYVPPPLAFAPRISVPDAEAFAPDVPQAETPSGVDRPPLVNPRQVKY